jgi:hypothetical protein
MQDGMAELNPLVCVRLRHLKELTLDFLNGLLFHIGQHEAELVGHCWSRTSPIRTVAATGTGLPLNGVILPRDDIHVLERPQEGGQFFGSSSRHGPSTPGALDDLFIAWHRHLQHSVMKRWAMVLHNP